MVRGRGSPAGVAAVEPPAAGADGAEGLRGPAGAGRSNLFALRQNTSAGFHLSTRRSARVTPANAATASPAPRTTVAYSSGARKL